jgi:LacI family transcriptional regulator
MKKVALLIETSNSYARGLMRGIAAYQREHERWSVYLSEGARGGDVPSWLGTWTGDGVIARIENGTIARSIRRLGIPVVDLSSARLIPGLHWVETDDESIARLAADHLVRLGVKHFAFCGDRGYNWSVWREEHFRKAVTGAGYPCHVFNTPRPHDSDGSLETGRMAEWIAGLPKPVGLFACHDSLGRQALELCREGGIGVPDEVSVLGVDDDEMICELCEPPLSSVIPNTRLTGYTAAELLERLMSGERIPPSPHLVEPLGIATRRSTDVLTIEDANTAAALRYIRENACGGMCVKDVIAAVPQSRRGLESRFRKLLGRTPHEEIIRVRMERVKTLLIETDLSLACIAERTGFPHAEYLNVAFRREAGLPPGRYRLLNRPGSRSLRGN